MRLLAATTNPGKLREILLVLGGRGIELVSLQQFPEVTAPEESGKTFEENAVLKAKYYFEHTGLPSLADDGGLIVDALNGLPGVNSHRWLGHDATDQELAEAVVKKLKGVAKERRTARLGGYLAFWDGVHLLTVSNYIEGYITEELPRDIEPGLPYRAVLVVPPYNKLYKDLTHKEHEAVNHRRKNLAAIAPKIIEILNRKG